MDDVKRRTLGLIEGLTKQLPHEDAQVQLIMLAVDYVEDQDMAKAKDVMAKLDPAYLRGAFFVRRVENDAGLLRALILLVETFGEDLGVYARRGGAA